MSNFTVLIPALIEVGGGSARNVGSILRQLDRSKPLIVSDPTLVKIGLVTTLQSSLTGVGVSSDVFSETVPDPTSDVVMKGVATVKSGGYDCLVAIGGGSPIDTAKAMSALAANEGTIRDYRTPNSLRRPGVPVVAIPTTAGTGSEVTRFTVITDSATDEKLLITSPFLVPSAAVVDYELTVSMPARLTADTGLDALTHAIEAYVSRKANPFSDALAIAAMKTIWESLPKVYANPGDRASRERLMLAATQAGMAFSNASVALVHGMSRPIGGHFHVAHGLSNAMLLPAVTAFSISSALERYARCARTIGVAQHTTTDAAAAEQLIQALYGIARELGVPSPKSHGIAETDYFNAIPTMAAQALASGSPNNNPRVPTREQIEEIYRAIW